MAKGHRGKNRDYEAEYKLYHAKPAQIKRRDGRNKARSIMKKKVGAKKLKGKDIDHKNRNALDESPKNLRVQSIKKNRGRSH